MDDAKILDLYEIAEKGIEAVNRLASGIQRLVEEPMIEIENAPPQCPHCHRLNPDIKEKPATGEDSGPLSQYILEATCTFCKNTIYCVTQSWQIFKDPTSLRESLLIMQKGINVNNSE